MNQPPKLRPWILVLGGLVSAALVGTGLALTLRAARPADAPVILDKKTPSDFGLPTYPGAFGFHAAHGGAEGSVSYSVRKGTADQIVAFHRKQLEGRGWIYLSRRETRLRLGDATTPVRPTASGYIVRWSHPTGQQQLTLTALDLPQKGTTAQVLLGWSHPTKLN